MMPCVFDLAFGVLRDARQAYADHGELSDEVLQGLHDIFGQSFVEAVRLLETADVVLYECPNLRRVTKVQNQRRVYTLFPDVNFCCCPTFMQQVLVDGSTVTCQHVLAAHLAAGTTETVTDLQLADLMNDTTDYVNDLL